jgi:enterochelin esterase-like enzyme
MSIRSKKVSVKVPLFASVVFIFIASGLALQSLAQTQTPQTSPDDRYVLGPDSLPQPDVPAGTVSEFTLPDSSTYRGYSHKWWLYVPARYDGKTPLALMVFQDGGRFVQRDGMWRVPVVLDNLISRNELPLMAAVFVDPGQAIRPTQISSEQRSYEYDTLSDQYARFLISEILPEVKRHVRVTDNADGRGIAGGSSGGICAFTVAWQRPDQFRKVFSAIGSFVNIRGGGAYPDMVRQSAMKPLRVFLQDGINDELGGRFKGLNWPEGNRAMSAALAARGYDYQLVMGEGTHSGRHGAAIFPDAMRWLWRDYRGQ